jgi:hypothetical protein
MTVRNLNLRERQPLMFYLHPWELDLEQPRGKVSWLTGIRHYHNVARCEQRLRRLVRRWSFTTVSEVLQCQAANVMPETSLSKFA